METTYSLTMEELEILSRNGLKQTSNILHIMVALNDMGGDYQVLPTGKIVKIEEGFDKFVRVNKPTGVFFVQKMRKFYAFENGRAKRS